MLRVNKQKQSPAPPARKSSLDLPALREQAGGIAYTLFLFVLLFFPLFPVYATETLQNTGLITKNVWYSKDPFFSGDRVRIYSVIFNGSAKDLRGRVDFYDNNSLLCTSDFSSLSGRPSEIWCDWSVSGSGKHTISIKIINPRASAPGEAEQDVSLSNSDLAEDQISVDQPPAVAAPAAPPSAKDSLASGVSSGAGAGSAGPGGAVQQIVSGVSGAISGVVGFVTGSFGAQPLPYSKTASTSALRVMNVAVDTAVNTAMKDVSNFKSSSTTSAVFNYLNSNLANVYSVFALAKDWLLTILKNASATDNKPLSYVMLFFYGLAKFILESPIILTLLAIYVVWKIVRLTIFR